MRTTDWQNIKHWDLVIPPSRPSPVQLLRLRKLLEPMGRHERIAILGSTPEFRELLISLGFNSIFVFEKNKGFNEQMTRMLPFPKRTCERHETLVVGDWNETLKDYRRSFSLVLSDLTMGNIPYEKRDFFYRSIAHSLRSEGRYIDKVLTHRQPHLALDYLDKKYLIEPLNIVSANNFSCHYMFCSELLDMASVVDTSDFYDTLKSRFRNKPHLRALLGLSELVTPKGGLWYYGRAWRDVAADYFRHLKAVACQEEPRSSPYHKRCFHYILKAR